PTDIPDVHVRLQLLGWQLHFGFLNGTHQADRLLRELQRVGAQPVGGLRDGSLEEGLQQRLPHELLFQHSPSGIVAHCQASQQQAALIFRQLELPLLKLLLELPELSADLSCVLRA
ncbi:MAG: hypothetical protein ACK559_08565, partial [bacterium]